MVREAARRVARWLEETGSLALVAHAPPDADGVGSALCLREALRRQGKEAYAVCAEPLAGGLATLPGAQDVKTWDQVPPHVDAALLMDCAMPERSGRTWEELGRWATSVGNLDHHATNSGYGHVAWVDPTAPSTTALVVEVVDAWDQSLTPTMATWAYAGLVTDTQRFTAPDVGAGAHRLAARLLEAGALHAQVVRALYGHRTLADVRLLARSLSRLELAAGGRVALLVAGEEDFSAVGLSPQQGEDLAEVAASLTGVWVAAYVRPDGRGGVRVGLRANDPRMDVGRLAQRLGGGGHRAAGGFWLPGPVGSAALRVRELLEEETAVAGE
jgi:phosphoesterase RecJ-like protein